MLDARGRLLRAVLGFVTLRAAPRHAALDVLHQYMDSWRGVGAVAAYMERLRRPLEVLYLLTGIVLIVLGAGGLYVLARQVP